MDYIIEQLKLDRQRAFELLDKTREYFAKELIERDEKIAEQHKHIVQLNNEMDPLTLKIERLEMAAKRRRNANAK